MSRHASIYSEGIAARNQSQGIRECPYPAGTSERVAWLRGWVFRDARMWVDNRLAQGRHPVNALMIETIGVCAYCRDGSRKFEGIVCPVCKGQGKIRNTITLRQLAALIASEGQ